MVQDYRVPVLEQFEWQQPVASMNLTTPPGSPARGDRYLIAAGASGDWSGEDKNIATCSNATGPVWLITDAKEGMITWVTSLDQHWHYENSEWVPHGKKDKDEVKRYALLVGAP